MRWGYTARSWHAARAHGILTPKDAEQDGPIRHAWDGQQRTGSMRRLHARCGAALINLAPQTGTMDDHFDAKHPRACRHCANPHAR